MTSPPVPHTGDLPSSTPEIHNHRKKSVKHLLEVRDHLGCREGIWQEFSRGPVRPSEHRRQALQERWDQQWHLPCQLNFVLGGPGLCLSSSSTSAKGCWLSRGQGTKTMAEWSSQASWPVAPLGFSLTINTAVHLCQYLDAGDQEAGGLITCPLRAWPTGPPMT